MLLNTVYSFITIDYIWNRLAEEISFALSFCLLSLRCSLFIQPAAKLMCFQSWVKVHLLQYALMIAWELELIIVLPARKSSSKESQHLFIDGCAFEAEWSLGIWLNIDTYVFPWTSSCLSCFIITSLEILLDHREFHGSFVLNWLLLFFVSIVRRIVS